MICQKNRLDEKIKYVSCNCRFCFFCKNGYTNGTFHDRSQILMTSPTSGKKRKKMLRVLKIDSSLQTFFLALVIALSVTMRSQIIWEHKRKNCHQTYKSCPSCNEPICEECWKVYDNNRHRP